MSIKQVIKMPDFEADQREDLDGANDANKLSDQVVKLQRLEEELLAKEEELKELEDEGKSIANLSRHLNKQPV